MDEKCFSPDLLSLKILPKLIWGRSGKNHLVYSTIIVISSGPPLHLIIFTLSIWIVAWICEHSPCIQRSELGIMKSMEVRFTGECELLYDHCESNRFTTKSTDSWTGESRYIQFPHTALNNQFLIRANADVLH